MALIPLEEWKPADGKSKVGLLASNTLQHKTFTGVDIDWNVAVKICPFFIDLGGNLNNCNSSIKESGFELQSVSQATTLPVERCIQWVTIESSDLTHVGKVLAENNKTLIDVVSIFQVHKNNKVVFQHLLSGVNIWSNKKQIFHCSSSLSKGE